MQATAVYQLIASQGAWPHILSRGGLNLGAEKSPEIFKLPENSVKLISQLIEIDFGLTATYSLVVALD